LITPQDLAHLAPPLRHVIAAVFAQALPPSYACLIPLLAVGFQLALLPKEIPLRTRAQPDAVPDEPRPLRARPRGAATGPARPAQRVNHMALLTVLVDKSDASQQEPIMRHPRIIFTGLGLAVAVAIGGVTAASAASSPASHSSTASQNAAATVHTVQAAVAGKTETVLVNGAGMPLYYYRPDTATKSLVTGELASLWPPVAAPSPAATGLSGKLTVVKDAHGDQVAYNGHLLYTFADDHAGQVTGQGVENFFVATPSLAQIGGSSAPAAPASSGYGY
jgi:predicted lipoprotein with Yx(FWY)xxD motif